MFKEIKLLFKYFVLNGLLFKVNDKNERVAILINILQTFILICGFDFSTFRKIFLNLDFSKKYLSECNDINLNKIAEYVNKNIDIKKYANILKYLYSTNIDTLFDSIFLILLTINRYINVDYILSYLVFIEGKEE